MMCFQRDGTEAVPGCNGEGDEGSDYCIVPPPNMLMLLGNNGKPEEVFPLGLCKGDCDDDDECDDGLICLQLSKSQQVDGCVGESERRNDYCVPDTQTNVISQKSNVDGYSVKKTEPSEVPQSSSAILKMPTMVVGLLVILWCGWSS